MKILTPSLFGKIIVALYVMEVCYAIFFANVYVVSEGLRGTSMKPLFRNGDILIIQTEFIDRENLANGTIIVFHGRNNLTICHRIINIYHDEQGVFYLTKGDHNQYHDGNAVRPEQIIGVVVWRLRL